MTVSLSRRADWRLRYDACIESLRRRPLAWSETDCVIGLGAGVVEALTGVDLAAQWRGTYVDEAGALAAIAAAGADGLIDLVATMLPQIHPSEAQIGDLVAVVAGGPIGFGLGAVNGERVFVMMPRGLGTVDLDLAVTGFRVG